MNSKNKQQNLENLIKILDDELVQCFKCNKKDKKHKMINFYNHKTKNNEYICSLCFKLQNRQRKRN
jgi:hypothetical protein